MTIKDYKRHKAAIDEWADGATIEYYSKEKAKWIVEEDPTWGSGDYRVKEELTINGKTEAEWIKYVKDHIVNISAYTNIINSNVYINILKFIHTAFDNIKDK